jgi:transposase InsO family protein
LSFFAAAVSPKDISATLEQWISPERNATVKRFHYESDDQLRQHLADFVSAYNFARRLKALKGLTPYEFICKTWSSQPERFTSNPLHQMPGSNI